MALQIAILMSRLGLRVLNLYLAASRQRRTLLCHAAQGFEVVQEEEDINLDEA
jgi:hypothetical protein